MVQVTVIAEGLTEEQFIKRLIAPAVRHLEVFVNLRGCCLPIPTHWHTLNRAGTRVNKSWRRCVQALIRLSTSTTAMRQCRRGASRSCCSRNTKKYVMAHWLPSGLRFR